MAPEINLKLRKVTTPASSIAFAELAKPWRTGKDEQAVRPTNISLYNFATRIHAIVRNAHHDDYKLCPI